MQIFATKCKYFTMMTTNYFVYFFLIIGVILILFESYFDNIYFKIIGIALVMFSVFKLQSTIPSKRKSDESSNSNLDD